MRSPRRLVLAVVATPGSTERLRPLARELATLVDVRSLDQVEGRADAVLVASVDSLAPAPTGVPVAVWVQSAREMAPPAQPPDSSTHPPPGPLVCLSPDREAIRAGAIGVPADALDVVALPVVAPLVRWRARQRAGLPAALTVHVGHAVDEPASALHLAAAATVTGPLLATALALGTPIVTTAGEADRLGLRAGVEVEVAEADACRAVADAIAVDDAWAARLSFAGRCFAERTLDLGHIARRLLDQLGLVPVQDDPLRRRLAELSTPPSAPIRRRVARATTCLVEER